MGVNEIDRIQSILESKYKEKGYITPEEILKIIEENNISVFQVDKITNRLLLKGIMIIDDPNNIEETEIEDWSHLNYDDILNKAITIEPELKQYINFYACLLLILSNIFSLRLHFLKLLYLYLITYIQLLLMKAYL